MAGEYSDGTDRSQTPFVDTSGDDPTIANKRMRGCYGCSRTGGECTAMDLSFESLDDWQEHRSKHHPVSCDHCDRLAAYKRDNSPGSVCYKHLPDNPDSVYKWKRTNIKSVVKPPKADGHIIEAVLPEVRCNAQ